MSAPQPPGVPELSATGQRVIVRTAREGDLPAYRHAVLGSRDRLKEWNPANPEDLRWHLTQQSDLHRTFMILARDLDPADVHRHGMIGKVNVTNVVRGRFASATMGYDAYDPYAGRGLFREGLALIVDLALSPAGMNLHRVEANVQPGNPVSAGMLRSLGFRHEGTIPRMLYLSDGDGVDAWRDHDSYAVTREEWPAEAYADNRRPYRGVLLTGGPSEVRAALGRALAVEMGVPRLPLDLVGDARVLLELARECPTGMVLDVPRLSGEMVGMGELLPVLDLDAPNLRVADVAHVTPSLVSRLALWVRGCHLG